ncbi:HLA class I histocompatibility antigen, alpha chain E-like, partial [Erythrolamprus reginae]|uniref:HLA class I histocompatibility antigen, alpha chain E-like n=1 Tax=Erythrolamprus reginae TaxID=121349 RepID=UPI00396C3C07
MEKKKVWIIEIAIPGDSRIVENQLEKLVKYEDLKIELQPLWYKPVKVVPVAIGMLGTVPMDLSGHLKTIRIDKISINCKRLLYWDRYTSPLHHAVLGAHPVLTQSWLNGATLDKQREQLEERQLAVNGTLGLGIRVRRLAEANGLAGASSHSMKYFITSISEPSQGLPQFVSLGFVDGQVFVRYDSDSRRMKPQVPWMEKVEKEDPQYWDRNTQILRGIEEIFRDHLETLRNLYNQSEGLHTWQRMYGCELRRDGSKGGFRQYGYEG